MRKCVKRIQRTSPGHQKPSWSSLRMCTQSGRPRGSAFRLQPFARCCDVCGAALSLPRIWLAKELGGGRSEFFDGVEVGAA